MNEQLIDKYDEWTEGEFESSIRASSKAAGVSARSARSRA